LIADALASLNIRIISTGPSLAHGSGKVVISMS
jgi:hypothetical protein